MKNHPEVRKVCASNNPVKEHLRCEACGCWLQTEPGCDYEEKPYIFRGYLLDEHCIARWKRLEAFTGKPVLFEQMARVWEKDWK